MKVLTKCSIPSMIVPQRQYVHLLSRMDLVKNPDLPGEDFGMSIFLIVLLLSGIHGLLTLRNYGVGEDCFRSRTAKLWYV